MAPFRIARPRFLTFFALEGGLILAVMYGLANLTLSVGGEGSGDLLTSVILPGGLFSLVLLVVQGSSLADQGDLRRELVLYSLICLVLGSFAFAARWILTGDPKTPPALVLLQGAIAVPIAVSVWRWFSVRFNVFNASRETVLIVGTGEMAQEVCRWIEQFHAAEYAVVGFADENDSRVGQVLAMGVRVQTDYDSLVSFARQRADRILVALDEKRGKLPVRELMELRLRGLEIEEATTFFERISGKISVETMLPSWLIFSEGFKVSPLRSVLKRAADILLSVVLLIVSFPLMLVSALAILVTSGTPVIYRQPRLGHDGREFDLMKFRSMRKDAEAGTGPTFASKRDPRVVGIGRWLRKLRIDELPQLANVLKGEMSFVGPRPEREHFVRQLEESIPYYGLRMTVRPGLTGWAQVESGYGASEEESLEKLKYDLYYIKHNNLLLDLWIVIKTIKVVLLGSGAR